MIIDNIEYDEDQIKKMLKNYNSRKKVVNRYAKKRYKNFKVNLTCDDENLRKEADEFFKKNRDNTRQYDQRMKEVKNAVCKYNYYKRRNMLDKFVTDDRFKDVRELLKNNSNRRGSAKNKYPELFENEENDK